MLLYEKGALFGLSAGWGEWRPQDGLDRCRPREVRLTAAGKVMMPVAWLLLAGGITGGIILGVMPRRQAEEVRLLRQAGVITRGQVTRLWRGGDNRSEYWISYSFAIGGRIFGGRAGISGQEWRDLSVGTYIPIHYLTDRPALSYLFNAIRRPMPGLVPFAVAIALAAASLLVMFSVRRQERLLSEGRAAPGRVTAISRFRTDKGRTIQIEFSLLSGVRFKGKAGPMKKPPEVGSLITVVYDPDNPRRHALYPMSLAALTNRLPLR